MLKQRERERVRGKDEMYRLRHIPQVLGECQTLCEEGGAYGFPLSPGKKLMNMQKAFKTMPLLAMQKRI